MRYLIDTCVISELVQKSPSKKVLEYVSSLDEEKLYLSVITIGEIKHGIELLEDGKKKKRLMEWVSDDLVIRFRGKIIDIDEQVMNCWAILMAKLDKIGKPMPIMDSIIAATSIKNNFTLISRNEKDFENTDVEVVNPWRKS